MDPVRQYQERFWSLWTVLKKIFNIQSSCTGECNQGRNCNCGPKKNLEFSDCIIKLHELARTIKDPVESKQVRLLADELAKIGNRLHEKNLENSNPSRSPRK